jgi:putative tryptophan/tyrosine transport system substrate-binding protein
MGHRMTRLGLAVVIALLPAPLAAEAQPTGKVYRIAFVSPSSPVAIMTDHGPAGYKAFFSELRRLGYVEGQNLVVDRRSGEGRTEHYPDLVRNVVETKPDVICAISSRMVQAFKAATTTIPIVANTGDPVADGLVASLSRPGGNITGVSSTAGDEIYGKQLQLLHELAPTASRIALLIPRALWNGRLGQVWRTPAQRLGLMLVGAPMGDPIQEAEYRQVFGLMGRDRVQAIVVGDNPENFTFRRVIVELATQARLPAIYAYRESTEVGGLVSYGADIADLSRRLAGYVDRILKGANPGDLPYQLPTKFELVINLKTAKALGLTIPQSLLLRADQVIE